MVKLYAIGLMFAFFASSTPSLALTCKPRKVATLDSEILQWSDTRDRILTGGKVLPNEPTLTFEYKIYDLLTEKVHTRTYADEVVFSPNLKRVALRDQKTFVIKDLDSDKELFSIPFPRYAGNFGFSKDGSFFFIIRNGSREDTYITVVDINKQTLSELNYEGRSLSGFDLRHGLFVFTIRNKWGMELLDALNGVSHHYDQTHVGWIQQIHFSKYDPIVFIQSSGRFIPISAYTGKIGNVTMIGHNCLSDQKDFTGPFYDPDKILYFICQGSTPDRDYTEHLIDRTTGELLETYKPTGNFLEFNFSARYSVFYHGDPDDLQQVSLKKVGSQSPALTGHWRDTISVTPNGKLAIHRSGDVVDVIDLISGQKISQISNAPFVNGGYDAEHQAAFSNDSRFISVGTENAEGLIYELSSGKLVYTFGDRSPLPVRTARPELWLVGDPKSEDIQIVDFCTEFE